MQTTRYCCSHAAQASTGHNDWEMQYNRLLAAQENRSVHPFREDNPDELWQVVENFCNVFREVPDDQKRKLLSRPLFPDSVDFDTPCSRETAKPLYYIMFCANEKALELVAPYLTADDIASLGPHNSTLVHCLIYGIEKGSTYFGNPKACIEWLLRYNDALKQQKNRFGQTPLDLLYQVRLKLLSTLRHIGHYGSSFTDVKGGSYLLTVAMCSAFFTQVDEVTKVLKAGA